SKSYSYTGSAVTPAVTVTLADGTPLSSDAGYEVYYANNTKVAAADASLPPTVTVKGTGNLYGTVKLYFEITPSSGQTLSFTLENLDYGTALTNQTTTLDGSATMAYTGSATYARVSVKNGDTPLISGTDYTISYSNNVDVTTLDSSGSVLKPTVTINGIGNYANTTVNLTYSITRKDISNFVVEQADADGDNVPEFTVRASSTTTPLVESTDYTVTYDDNSFVGAKTATITGINNYEGTISVDYSIGDDIADAANGYRVEYTYACIDSNTNGFEVHKTSAAISNTSDNVVTFDTLYLGLTGRPVIKLLDSSGAEVPSTYYSISYDSTARKVGNTVTATIVITPGISLSSDPGAIYYSSRTLTVKYTISPFNTTVASKQVKKAFFVPNDAASVSTETVISSSTYETAYYTYTGSEVTPYKTMYFKPSVYNTISSGLTVVVFDNGGSGDELLTMGTDYTISTADGTTVGPESSTAAETVTLTMTNTNITGTHTRTVMVEAANPDDIAIYATGTTSDIRSNIEYDSTNLAYPNGYTKNYTGAEITPFGSDLNLYYGVGANKTKLLMGEDYTVDYYDGSSATGTVTPSNVTSLTKTTPVNSGVWYVVITLSSNFGNSKIYGSFVINKKSLANAQVYIWDNETTDYARTTFASYNYDGTIHKPVANDQGTNGFIVKDSDGTTLEYGTDYTVVYGVADSNYGDDYKLPGKYSVTITGTGSGNYASTTELTSSYTTLTYKVIGDISNTTLFSFYEGVSSADAYVGNNNYIIDKNAQGNFVSSFDPTQFYLSVNGTSVKYQYNKGFIIYGLDNLTTPGEVTLSFAGDGDYYTGMRYYTVYSYGDIADAEVTGLNDTYTYTGSAINPTGVSLSYNGVALTKNTHYTTALSNNIDIGTAGYTITGMGYFTAGSGSVIKNFNIKYDLSKMTLSASDAQTYNYGNPVYLPDTTNIRYALKGADAKTWKLSDMAATAATPFKATYSNNTEAGTAEITLSVTDSDKAFGSAVFTYTIKPIQLDASTMTVTLSDASSTYTYTGEEIQPPISSVKIGTTVLQEDVDYYVTYANNINSAPYTADNAPTIYINGYGNYSGSVTKTFTIDPVDLTSVGVISLTPADGKLPYSGGTGMLPTYEVTATVNSNTRTLTEGSDFTVTYSPLVTVPGDTGFITVQGNGNYTGSVSSATYTVTKCALSSASITKAVQEAEYTGKAFTPSLKVTVTFADSTKTLTEGTDYDVSYGGASMVNAGAYTITISAPASSAYYEGSTTTTFTINPKDLGTDGGMQVDGTVITIPKTDDADDGVDDEYEVSAVDTQDWNTGNQVMPELIIHDVSNDNPEHGNTPNYKTLVKDTDYTIEWTNNRDAATSDPTNPAYDATKVPTITVTGKGNYTGKFTKTFTIGKDIADSTKYQSELSAYSYTYNGTSQVPDVTVNNLTTTPTSTLTEDTDYTVVAPTDSINAQDSVELKIQGKNSFYGSITETYVIQKKTINPANLVIDPDTATLTKTYDEEGTVYSYFESDTDGYYYWATTYNGSAMEPAFHVYDTEISATVPIDSDMYTISYNNNTNAGGVISPATAQVVLGGNYNTYSATPFKFVILPYGGGITLALTASEMAYTGRSLTPDYTVTNASGQILVKDQDYTIEFANNKNAGTATVTVTGINNYINNNASQTFVIYANLTESCVTITDQLYTGSAITPGVTVVCGGNTLVNGTDYQITTVGSDNNYTTSGYVIVDSLQPTYYRNTPITVPFNIVFGSDYLSVSGAADQYTYTGNVIKPTLTVKDNNGNVLPASVAYNSSTDGNACIQVGTVTYTATVTVAGQSLVKTGTYKIIQRNVNTCTFGNISNDTYTGSNLTPPVSVTYQGENLVKGSGGDYVISYANNTNPGVASVTVTGVNNYSGTRTMYFTISIGSVVKLSAKGTSNKKIKVSWTKVNHASGYEVTYSADNKTYTKTTTSNSYTVSGLKQAKAYNISVKAYKTIAGKKYYGTSSTVTGKTLVSTPSFKVKSSAAKKAKLSWKKNTSATGYTIYRSTKKNKGFKKIADVPSSKSNWTNKKLTSKKKYYYYIRAYQLIDGKKVYGSKSKVKAVTVK
ncbi:MAG: fibronectin type III domain-containing protein, partial [Lachnospiraceae bacterium]|nr:fibronectin type III domain-containing protein [Lachnospiraceae bacterium]